MTLLRRTPATASAVDPPAGRRRRGRLPALAIALSTVATAGLVPAATPAEAAVDWNAGVRAIQAKYDSGGYLLGAPTTAVTFTPERFGLYRHYAAGSIYWSENTGARMIYGAIREHWADLGWENSHLGFPLTDELDGGTPCNASAPGMRHTRFEGGAICWWPAGGTGWWPNSDYRVHTVTTYWAAITGLGRVRQPMVTIAGFWNGSTTRSITCTGLRSGRTATRVVEQAIPALPKSFVVPLMVGAGEEVRCTMVHAGDIYLPNNTVTAALP